MAINYTPIKHPNYPGFYVIPGYAKYVISTRGEIQQIGYSVNRGKGTIIPHKINRHKRHFVNVSADGKISRRTGINTLMCLAFHGPKPNPNYTAIHLNNDLNDNSYLNIVWGKNSIRNTAYAYNILSKQTVMAKNVKELVPLVNMPYSSIRNIFTKVVTRTKSIWIFSCNENENWLKLKQQYNFLGDNDG